MKKEKRFISDESVGESEKKQKKTTLKEKKERDAARQHINIDGNDYMIPQCNKCNSYDTILVELEELSTSYGNTEGYVEERFLKNVVKVRRTRYTDYNLTYKCKNCGEVGVKNLQTRTREHI